MPARISIADADPLGISTLAGLARAAGHEVRTYMGRRPGPGELRQDRPDVLLLGLDPTDEARFAHIAAIRAVRPAPVVIGLVERGDVTAAVRAVRAGAFDVLEKPILADRILPCLEEFLSAAQAESLAHADPETGHDRLLGRSSAMRAVRELVSRVAATPRTTVLVTGESGAGKELVARAVHERSVRAGCPFVAVNCASLSDALFEAELFGYAAGAFTGGNPRGQEGLVAAAEGGTLFLDEIGELPPAAQAKLLRFLQEKRYRRVGETSERACDVRIVAATNRDLAAEVETGRFREDLYYRLNVLSIHVPPLRERLEDVNELAQEKLRALAVESTTRASDLLPAAVSHLEGHSWPGNVRELHNVVARAALLAGTEPIGAEHLAFGGRARAEDDGSSPRRLREAEEELIRRALWCSNGNRSRAARELGIHRATLYNKMRAYGIR